MYHIETHFNSISNSKGFSIAEGLIALSILAITAFFSMPAIHNSYQMVNNFERKGKCEGLFNSANNAIELTPPEYRTANVKNGYWQAKINPDPVIADPSRNFAFMVPDDAIIQARFTRMGVNRLYDYTGATTVFGFLGGTGFDVRNNGVILYTPLLLSGPMGYLADLYNSGYCDAFLPAPDFIANSAVGVGANRDPNVQILMRVQKQNLLDQSISATCPKFWPRPRNNLNESVIKEPYSNFDIAKYPDSTLGPSWISDDSGFRVTLRAVIAQGNSGGGPTVCESTHSYNLPTDFQNVMDYYTDMNAVKKANNTPTPLSDPLADITIDYNRDRDIRNRALTPGLFQNKPAIFAAADPKLKTVMSNFRIIDNTYVFDRPECSQDGSSAATTKTLRFTLQLEVLNLSKEPGVIAMCNDTSRNYSDRDPNGNASTYAWCRKTGGAANAATVNIVVDDRTTPKAQGWVPCEALTFCGEKPREVRAVKTSDQSLRYEYDFAVDNSNNFGPSLNNPTGGVPNRLWGCELKYGVALVDPAGNLTYVPNKPATTKNRADFIATGAVTIAPSFMREINPKVYFQPPPCYLCSCKRCKSSKGLFGGFFNFFLLAVLTLATGGLIWLEVAVIFPAVTGLAAAACLTGNMGCSGSATYNAPNFDSVDFVDCRDRTNDGSVAPCSCGQRCRKEVPKGRPKWKDLDLVNVATAGITLPKPCDPQDKLVTTPGGNFYARLAYKYDNPTTRATEYLNTPVEHGDFVSWSQYDNTTGRYCYAVHMCQDGNFVVSQEPYENDAGTTVNSSQAGCYQVKTAHRILWDSKSDGKKPNLGEPLCLEIEFGLGPQNPSGGRLWSYADTEYECGQDTANRAIPPTFSTDPLRRFIGRSVPSQCPDSFSVTVPSAGTFSMAPAAALPIADYNGCPSDTGGAKFEHRKRNSQFAIINQLLVNAGYAAPIPASCTDFVCWAACVPPSYAPSNPLMGTEMRYYETSTATEFSSLPFCNSMPRLDSIYTPVAR